MATYKSAPTFTLDKEYFEEARVITLDLIMKGRFNLMSNGKVLAWIDEELARFKPKKEPTEKHPLNKAEDMGIIPEMKAEPISEKKAKV